MAVAIHNTKIREGHWLPIRRKNVSGVPETGGEISIRDRVDRFHLLVEAVRDYAIFLLDPEGRIASWNSGAERIKGYSPDEVIGKSFSIFYPDADLRSGKPQRQLERAMRSGRVEDQGWRVRKDGSKFWAGVVITALRDRCGRVYGFAKATRDLTEQKVTEEALNESLRELQKEVQQRMEAESSLRELSIQLLRLQDEERRRLGQELHDGVGQLLAGAKMCVDRFISQPEKASEEKLLQCQRLLEEAITEVRTVSYLLYPPLLEDVGLHSAAEWYVDGFRHRSGVQVTFGAPSDFGRLPRDIELVLFRVLQESLTNVHRHSGSATARVTLGIENNAVVLEIKDSGKGLGAAIPNSNGEADDGFGVGLRGMKERARHVGGTLSLSSSSNGTTVRVTIPLPEAEIPQLEA
jgi:PAS domain S-box-containing protein